MADRFHALSINEFAVLLGNFPFTRRIDTVHLHHTWRPEHRDYRGLPTIEAMWRYHTQTLHWSDIGQHVSIAPDGTIWTGRNWNRSPASATGHNGNSRSGPFMIEMIGNFDRDHDPFEGAQKEAALKVVALVQRQFSLPPEALRFHNQMSSKTCPGTSVDYAQTVDEVREVHASVAETGGTREVGAGLPFGPEALALQDAVQALGRVAGPDDSADAEPPEEETPAAERALVAGVENAVVAAPGAAERAARGSGLNPAQLAALRPHVINLRQGSFSDSGEYQSKASDVDAIFADHLPRALRQAEARNEPLRLVFYAHGGLVPESKGLAMAHAHVSWWLANNVYPIYFVWETGFMETLLQLLGRGRALMPQAAARDLWDHTTDPIIEALARTLGGVTVWGGMKYSAQLSAAQPDGGAWYLAEHLHRFCQDNQGKVELHAVGHSAGSIFHSRFIPAAMQLGVPDFRSVQFLAPAVRVDAFHQRLAPLMGHGIEHLTLFTMQRDWERDDNCGHIYRKSQLYLIYCGLEPEHRTPILGLEDALRADGRLRDLFGLSGHRSPVGEVVWSKSVATEGRCASTSTSHGGFDNDMPTMNSVLRRVLGKSDHDPIQGFVDTLGRALAPSLEEDPSRWPEGLETFARLGYGPQGPTVAPPAVAPVPAVPARPVTTPGGGRRRALCVGIDDYPTAPLSGCVADARAWARTLTGLGFEAPRMLLNGEASQQNILTSFRELVDGSRPGDVVVIQYSGHGTQLADVNGDEEDNMDEALCPHDFASGAFILDDDVAAVFARIPEGVNVTCFFDCCHSGTNTRFAVGASPAPGGDVRARFMVVRPEIEERHRKFREARGLTRAVPRRGTEDMRQVVFAACQDAEVAYEHSGQGDFTRHAVAVLAQGLAGLTNRAFQERVASAFGLRPSQHPRLDCAGVSQARVFLGPLVATTGASAAPVMTPAASQSDLEQAIQHLMALLQSWR